MPSLRIVLYAEGTRETSGQQRGSGPMRSIPAPGEPLPEESLGPGHVLVRRAIELVRQVPPQAVRFESPLRTRGRIARGSDLLFRRTLRELLSWPRASMRPHLAVVLVDRDGKNRRKEQLVASVQGLLATVVIGVPREEFEAWMIADEQASGQVLGSVLARTRSPEKMPPREAKSVLDEWVNTSVSVEKRHPVRRRIAELCDLEVIRRRCASFGAFLEDLGRLDTDLS